MSSPAATMEGARCVPAGTQHPNEPPAHLEDVVEVLLVHPEEVAVVLSQDDGGRAGRVVHQRQLPKVVPLVQGGHQALGRVGRGMEGEGWRGGSPRPHGGRVTRGVWRTPLRWDTPTLPWVTTFTEPFQMMYHDVPLSPWLNTAGETGAI